MDLIESLKTIHKTLDDHQGDVFEWNELNQAIDRVAAELGYEFRADGMVVCVKPNREEV